MNIYIPRYISRHIYTYLPHIPWYILIYIKMDLSSLEGPPICDPRFTPQARYHQPDTYIPSIRVDDTYNPRYPSGHYYRNTDYRDVSSSTGPRLNPNSTTGTGIGAGNAESRPRARSNPPPLQRQPDNTSTSSRPSTPNRLIWLDGEKTWLLIEARGLEPQHPRPQSLPRPPRPRPQPQPQSQPLQRARPQRQRQHQCLRQGQGADQPPSYGDHQHDRVIAVQPMSSRGRELEEEEEDDEYEDEEPRPGLARSKWGAVARRVNRMV